MLCTRTAKAVDERAGYITRLLALESGDLGQTRGFPKFRESMHHHLSSLRQCQGEVIGVV